MRRVECMQCEMPSIAQSSGLVATDGSYLTEASLLRMFEATHAAAVKSREVASA